MASAAEVAAMRRAIALSAAGLGTTSPNPPVGCVLLDPQDRIAGEGYRERKGEAHAEAAVIDPTSRGEGGVAELRRAGADVEPHGLGRPRVAAQRRQSAIPARDRRERR